MSQIEKAKEGDTVEVEGVGYRFGPSSASFFNTLLSSKDESATEDAMVDIKRKSDAEKVTIPFPKLKAAWEAQQE